MGAKIETDMRRDLFAHLLKTLSHSYLPNTKSDNYIHEYRDLFDITEFAQLINRRIFIAALENNRFIYNLLSKRLRLLCSHHFRLYSACKIFNTYMRKAFKKQRKLKSYEMIV